MLFWYLMFLFDLCSSVLIIWTVIVVLHWFLQIEKKNRYKVEFFCSVDLHKHSLFLTQVELQKHQDTEKKWVGFLIEHPLPANILQNARVTVDDWIKINFRVVVVNNKAVATDTPVDLEIWKLTVFICSDLFHVTKTTTSVLPHTSLSAWFRVSLRKTKYLSVFSNLRGSVKGYLSSCVAFSTVCHLTQGNCHLSLSLSDVSEHQVTWHTWVSQRTPKL